VRRVALIERSEALQLSPCIVDIDVIVQHGAGKPGAFHLRQLIGEYIATILVETRRRPRAVVETRYAQNA